MFFQKIGKGFIGELLKRLERVSPQQIKRRPSLCVEFNELSAGGLLAGIFRTASRPTGAFAGAHLKRPGY
jgi:hypothetical protein